MRDYIRSEASFRDSAFAFPALRRVVRNWIVRRQLLKLEKLDDYLLNDIGLSRDDIRWGLALPRDVDAVSALEDVRDRRMGRGVRHR